MSSSTGKNYEKLHQSESKSKESQKNDDYTQNKRSREEYEDNHHMNHQMSLNDHSNASSRASDLREQQNIAMGYSPHQSHPQLFCNQQQIFGNPNFQVMPQFSGYLHPGMPMHFNQQHLNSHMHSQEVHPQMLGMQPNNAHFGMSFPFGIPMSAMHMNPLAHLGHIPPHMMFASQQNQTQLALAGANMSTDHGKVKDGSKGISRPLVQVPDTKGLNPPPKKQKKEIPEWLYSVGEPCHSDRQLESGQDLSKIKKKYRFIKCLFCEEFNNPAPWASLKRRKYETETFIEHERSTHHIKAVLRRSTSMGEASNQLSIPSQQFLGYGQSPMLYRDTTPSAAMGFPYGHIPQMANKPSSSSSAAYTEQSSSSNHQGVENHLSHSSEVEKPSLASQATIPMHHLRMNFPQRQLDIRHIPGVISLAAMEHSKSKSPPIWLKVEGRLCHSDKQLESGQDLTSVKKKYKTVMCTFCRDFNPSSPWAALKTRKFETAVLNEHERSHHHRKAVNTRDIALGIIPTYDPMAGYEAISGMHPIPGLGTLQLGMGFPSMSGTMPGLYVPGYATGPNPSHLDPSMQSSSSLHHESDASGLKTKSSSDIESDSELE
jgi:hypothetical protein